MKWNIKKTDEALLKKYQEELNIDEILAKILINRNVDIKTADVLLNNPEKAMQDPYLLLHAEKAATEIIDAVEKDSEIWVFADYDVDGITSGFVITDFLRRTTNNNIYVYYPERDNGYGLNMEFCHAIAKRKEEENIKNMMVITVDNGTSSVEEVEFLKENKIDVVITDHHMPKDTLPNCTIVNPHLTNDPVYHHLSGCGTVFKVIQIIEDAIGIKEKISPQYLFAVALGTIADMMPMTPENIAFSRLGLKQINGKNCPKTWKYFKKHLGKKKLGPLDVAWDIGPRLNACGRMGQIDKGAILFFMNDDDDESDILNAIIEIEEINEERKAMTRKAEKEIEKIDYSKDSACLFDASEYPSGISGIIASRITEKHGKVALVYASKDGKVATGSARAPEGIDLQPILQQEVEKGNLISFGGHQSAAGFRLDMEKIDALKESLNKALKEVYKEHYGDEAPTQEIFIDHEIDLSKLNKDTYESIHLFPYDKSEFPSPLFAIRNLEVIDWRTSRNNENNICLTVKDENGKEMDIWAWRMGEKFKEIDKEKKIDIAGKIEQSFINKKQYTMNIIDIRESPASSAQR